MSTIYFNPNADAYQGVLAHPKAIETTNKIIETFLNICLTVDSPLTPYPTISAEVKPYWNYVLNAYVKKPELEKLDDRVRAIACVIQLGILVPPGQDNIPGVNLKSMISAVGQKNATDFIAMIELEAIKKLVSDLDSECPGLVDRLVAEKKN